MTRDDVAALSRRRIDEAARGPRAPSRDGDGLVQPTMVPQYLEGRAPERQREGRTAERPAYYAYPPLKKPHWKFHVPLYFYLGGIAAGTQLVASLAALFGGRREAPVVRAGRYLSAPLVAIAQLLLIADLGRPERAHHMFRIVKTRSPMSMGSWGLALFSGVSGLLFVLQGFGDVLRARWAAAIAMPLAVLAIPASLFTGGYTGVLLSATAVPLWAKGRGALPPLFLSSALATGGAAIGAMLALVGRAPRSPALATAIAAGLAGELAAEAALEATLGESRRHLTAPPEAIRHRAAVALGVVAPLVLLAPAIGGRAPSASRLLLASALALAGGLVTRFSIIEAGKHSADDASSYWDWTHR